ncbi:thiamine pyrophosphate-dependent dehydrogenase E1 component subunit alpha [Halosegnis marinus]|uniref:Thiamine pyrophosphate-dependent dehydrogenase E1 component subunit alpha n=1 Tax=Halosegnis marinus TaxID=3034023 RepID=A0ABD5ZL70_9EURY|nr:thiamine pyrophosphate-dependent dehydrogenase E1 component subunit alpha [Halosegnis sp. DT85]
MDEAERRALLDRDHDDRIGFLAPDGTLREGYEPSLPPDRLVALYADMKLGRHFDDRMVSLQRQGRIGTYSPMAGQEGSGFGSMYALAEDDWVFYQYREHAAPLVRGFPPGYLHYWSGHESGTAALADANVFPLNICIGDHIPHVTGMGMAARLQGNDDEAFVAHFGDGATSEGDFHEGLNFAGVYDTPTVFLCHNNGWAISVPREEQTRSRTIAQKADAYGFEGVQVDGMDPLAVYEVTRAAREKALDPREGEARPTLVEAVEYRYGAHTTADDPSAYRDDDEVEQWRRVDPIDRLEAYLRREGLLDDDEVERIESENADRMAAAVDDLAEVEADPDEMFADVFAEPTPRMVEQREYLRDLRERHGDAALLREE